MIRRIFATRMKWKTAIAGVLVVSVVGVAGAAWLLRSTSDGNTIGLQNGDSMLMSSNGTDFFESISGLFVGSFDVGADASNVATLNFRPSEPLATIGVKAINVTRLDSDGVGYTPANGQEDICGFVRLSVDATILSTIDALEIVPGFSFAYVDTDVDGTSDAYAFDVVARFSEIDPSGAPVILRDASCQFDLQFDGTP